jgi:enoyl-[acyl-carrier protein] reductase/trans-2-enoyl-CoA reductase (NAD+)
MIIQPRIRGFVCVTAHPVGCAAHVQEQIDVVKGRGRISGGPRNVLILGASTGYGLATRIATAFGCRSNTLGVFYERPGDAARPASAGWYNSAAFHRATDREGIWAHSINGDAFSDEIKGETLDVIRKQMGKIDLVVYSLASPRRTDPRTGKTYNSTLKPIGKPYTAKNLNTDKHVVEEITIQPASQEEIDSTIKVMGGEDWELWMEALEGAGLLAEGATAVAYDYTGPQETWPVYRDGTIGRAKIDLKRAAKRIDAMLKQHRGVAFVSVNKAVVTQASSAIPVVPLYISILFRVMKDMELHEGCIEQMDRMLRTQLCSGGALDFDAEGRVRMDEWELRADVQAEVARLWKQVNTDNLDELSDSEGYHSDFLKLFGFGMEGVDYDADVDPDVPLMEA